MSSGLYRLFCFCGMGLIALGVIYSSLRYRGRNGQKYSILNHFISELGEVGVSQAAWAFNWGLILGGIVTLPYIIGLGIKFASPLGWLGTAAGLVATGGVSAVGVFPMNRLESHGKAAMTYFRSGLVMVFFFGLAILLQPAGKQIVHPLANLLSLFAFGVYAAFLVLLKPPKKSPDEKGSNPLDPMESPQRPRFWLLPALEWAVFFATLLWLLGLSFFI
jgi:hypothetical membrane protein